MPNLFSASQGASSSQAFPLKIQLLRYWGVFLAAISFGVIIYIIVGAATDLRKEVATKECTIFEFRIDADTCEPFSYKCEHGVAPGKMNKMTANSTMCKSCDKGYILAGLLDSNERVCVIQEKAWTCLNGTPLATGKDSTSKGDFSQTKCHSCDENFELKNEKCAKKSDNGNDDVDDENKIITRRQFHTVIGSRKACIQKQEQTRKCGDDEICKKEVKDECKKEVDTKSTNGYLTQFINSFNKCGGKDIEDLSNYNKTKLEKKAESLKKDIDNSPEKCKRRFFKNFLLPLKAECSKVCKKARQQIRIKHSRPTKKRKTTQRTPKRNDASRNNKNKDKQRSNRKNRKDKNGKNGVSDNDQTTICKEQLKTICFQKICSRQKMKDEHFTFDKLSVNENEVTIDTKNLFKSNEIKEKLLKLVEDDNLNECIKDEFIDVIEPKQEL